MSKFCNESMIYKAYAKEKLSKRKYYKSLINIKDKPYFASFIYQDKEGNTYDIYMALTYLKDKDYDNILYDWRSPICSLFYDYEIGPCQYQVDDYIHEGKLLKKRQYIIDKRKLISETINKNQLFFSVACTMNDQACINAMNWFRNHVLFSRNYSDIPAQLLEYSEDPNMLKSISDYAKAADLGIEEMQFEINNHELSDELIFPDNMPVELKNALSQFIHTLSERSINSELRLNMGEVKATSLHKGVNQSGEINQYKLELSDESDGTRKLMSIAPAVESVLANGGVLLVDELETELHPTLVNFIIAKFQSKKTNPNGAQIIFTTHDTELMSMELIRKDQLYFVDKDTDTGISELYSISDFGTRTTENIRKGYLLGKYGAIPNIEIEEVE